MGRGAKPENPDFAPKTLITSTIVSGYLPMKSEKNIKAKAVPSLFTRSGSYSLS
jgi:hypothetical protein